MLKMIIIILIIIVSCALVLYLYCHFENRKFKVTEYTVYSDKVKKNLKLCVISDLHNYCYGENNSRLMLAIDKMNPDMVVSAGDMIEAGVYVGETKKTIDFLYEVSKKYPFFYGVGNHETMLYNEKITKYDGARKDFFDAIEKYKKINVDMSPIRDGYIDLDENNIRIYSLNVENKYFRKFKIKPIGAEYIESKLGPIDADKLNILVGHDPNQIKDYAQYGVDMVLSGHVHGGMIALPNGRGLVSTLYTLFPKYYAGMYEEDGTLMIVSRGIGNHSIHVRINNRAELLCINIKKDK